MPLFYTEPAEPGTLFEVFLPKRMEYQSKLYEALEHGLQLENVQAFLKAAGRNDAELEKRRIRELIPGAVVDRYTDERIDRLKQVYFGFSLYEVDGVFVTDPSDPGHRRTQERTQVVRLFFKPDPVYGAIRNDRSLTPQERSQIMEKVRQSLQDPVSWNEKVAVMSVAGAQGAMDHTETLRSYLNAVDEWNADVLLFVFGYVVGKITEDVAVDEKEIWVTSQRSVVNVVRRGRRPRTPRVRKKPDSPPTPPAGTSAEE